MADNNIYCLFSKVKYYLIEQVLFVKIKIKIKRW